MFYFMELMYNQLDMCYDPDMNNVRSHHAVHETYFTDFCN